ncbi:MAG: pilus (MSHA type) biogenesis protein MshL [Herminiimonas sp.]|nr:pilus (MSHA type) biogenesis protein MshL [Herminiimonas sp.]
MKKPMIAFMVCGLAGCSTAPASRQTYDTIQQEMDKAAAAATTVRASAAARPTALPLRVSDALLPPLQPVAPPPPARSEERFSVAFNEVEARQFFPAVAANTRYNILVHPKVDGRISANLKNVTLFEALDSVRDIYGYDYTVEGNRIVIKPLTMQTRVFQVNYLNTSRQGTSETRVSAGSGGQQGNNSNQSSNSSGNANQSGAQNSTTGNGGNQQNTNGGNQNNSAAASSRVSSTSTSDFWTELRDSLKAIVNIEERDGKSVDKDGRSVVVSRQSGVVVVRAMPDELRAVAQYLKASQLSVERQVILEAKILEVQLNDSFQSGINWASFSRLLGNPLGIGFVAPGTTLTGASISQNGFSSTTDTINPRTGLRGESTFNISPAGAVQATGNAAGSLFGIAVQGSTFAALLTFLETQGTVHVLSSPRIATMNNQKAILKVGTDDFFVTKVSSTVNTSTVGTSTTPDVTLQQFFSGVVLDVTPQIDEFDNIILHVHPSVTEVTTLNRVVNLGQLGTLNLPLASSNTSETDSVVRGQTGQIIAIGGLMRQATTNDRSQVPVAGDVPVVGNLFKNNNRVTQKRELVILIKPTIIDGGASWGSDLSQSQRRIQALDPQQAETRR